MGIIIKDLKKSEELDRQAVMRFCRGGNKQPSGIRSRKTSPNDLKERLLKHSESEIDR